ncbi:DUF6807 family protein [Propioniciclava coleopterorum]|uniref:DUF6807 family protein n=1 Tax=Propioniciclava coleopterorum TaxID=2714937 RepID=UPI003D70E236
MAERARVTISDVAKAAAVSPATVSRVMNGQTTVDPVLAERVRRVASELAYHPSSAARSLSLGRTQAIAVLVPELGNPMFQRIVEGIMESASAAGYRVLVTETGPDPDLELQMARDARARCDAVLWVSPRATDEALVPTLAEIQPALVVGRPAGSAVCPPGLTIDYRAGIHIAVDHLIGLGHQDIVYLGGPAESSGDRARRDAWEEVQADHPYLRVVSLRAGYQMQDGFEAAPRVLDTGASAVVAFNDLVAFGLLSHFGQVGVSVPRDVSVVGFDDIDLAGFALPALTTLGVGHRALGDLAWQQLAGLLTGSEQPAGAPFAPRLVARNSTGAAPAAKSRAAHQRQRGRAAIPPQWRTTAGREALLAGDLELAAYHDGSGMPTVHARRPYLHPLRTLGGRVVTAAHPENHRHQYGLSLAPPEVNGTSFWGGRTYVPGSGATLLPNHGQQIVQDHRVVEGDEAALEERLAWLTQTGEVLLEEQRKLSASLLPDGGGWALTWRSVLTASSGDLTFSSPGVRGRPGAGYAGLFWRFAEGRVERLIAPDGEGEPAINGRVVPWVAGVNAQDPLTVVFTQLPGEERPWFGRTSDYTGLGPSLAWDRPLTLPAGESLTLGLRVLLLDALLDRDEIDELTRAT